MSKTPSTYQELEDAANDNAARAEAVKSAGQGQVEAMLAIYYQLQILCKLYHDTEHERYR